MQPDQQHMAAAVMGEDANNNGTNREDLNLNSNFENFENDTADNDGSNNISNNNTNNQFQFQPSEHRYANLLDRRSHIGDAKFGIAIHCTHCRQFAITAPACPCDISSDHHCISKNVLYTHYRPIISNHANSVTLVRSQCARLNCNKPVPCQSCNNEAQRLAGPPSISLSSSSSSRNNNHTTNTNCPRCHRRFCMDCTHFGGGQHDPAFLRFQLDRQERLQMQMHRHHLLLNNHNNNGAMMMPVAAAAQEQEVGMLELQLDMGLLEAQGIAMDNDDDDDDDMNMEDDDIDEREMNAILQRRRRQRADNGVGVGVGLGLGDNNNLPVVQNEQLHFNGDDHAPPVDPNPLVAAGDNANLLRVGVGVGIGGDEPPFASIGNSNLCVCSEYYTDDGDDATHNANDDVRFYCANRDQNYVPWNGEDCLLGGTTVASGRNAANHHPFEAVEAAENLNRGGGANNVNAAADGGGIVDPNVAAAAGIMGDAELALLRRDAMNAGLLLNNNPNVEGNGNGGGGFDHVENNANNLEPARLLMFRRNRMRRRFLARARGAANHDNANNANNNNNQDEAEDEFWMGMIRRLRAPPHWGRPNLLARNRNQNQNQGGEAVNGNP
eukprot:CAMPEP_0116023420 /NCGR_PEP_ID=MMETSP0321-20121206/11587_1 /TAXON_ID=163516 /ORGANISM="Leptocylindrus danicus var. danicus, Strain B650" /LENGTH=609 /DNA_ID=CAMNT_0003494709 /DNA_START=707 /DNA_END=2536 /DNA_ORIENTATION=-